MFFSVVFLYIVIAFLSISTFFRSMANEFPNYDELLKPPQGDALPRQNQPLATQTPLHSYKLIYNSSKLATLTPTSPSNASSSPSYNIALTYQQNAFRKRLPDITISQVETDSLGSSDSSSSTVALVIFDLSSSNSLITYPSRNGGSPRSETLLRLESALTREYVSQISGEACYILPATSDDNAILLVEHKGSRSNPWARFIPPCSSSPKPSPKPSQSASVDKNKPGFLRKFLSSSSQHDKQDLGGSQEYIGTLEIYRRDLDDDMRDEVICVLVSVVERTKRMKATMRKEKGGTVRNYAYGAAMMNVV